MNCIGIKGHFDSIIASTAFLNKGYILTANQKHFPEPCFKEIKKWSISCKDDNNRTIHHMIYLLALDMKKAAEKFNKIEYVKDTVQSSK